MKTIFRKSMIVSCLAFGAACFGSGASADPGNGFRWETAIGIAAPNNVVGAGTGAATGAPGPWSARGGRVRIDPDYGTIDFNVDGLVLASGNAIGTPGTVTQVKGTLICDTDGSASGGNSVVVETPLVPLDDQGDARFHGSVGALPAVCTSEADVAFLIRTASGRWIGNGAVLR